MHPQQNPNLPPPPINYDPASQTYTEIPGVAAAGEPAWNSWRPDSYDPAARNVNHPFGSNPVDTLAATKISEAWRRGPEWTPPRQVQEGSFAVRALSAVGMSILRHTPGRIERRERVFQKHTTKANDLIATREKRRAMALSISQANFADRDAPVATTWGDRHAKRRDSAKVGKMVHGNLSRKRRRTFPADAKGNLVYPSGQSDIGSQQLEYRLRSGNYDKSDIKSQRKASYKDRKKVARITRVADSLNRRIEGQNIGSQTRDDLAAYHIRKAERLYNNHLSRNPDRAPAQEYTQLQALRERRRLSNLPTSPTSGPTRPERMTEPELLDTIEGVSERLWQADQYGQDPRIQGIRRALQPRGRFLTPEQHRAYEAEVRPIEDFNSGTRYLLSEVIGRQPDFPMAVALRHLAIKDRRDHGEQIPAYEEIHPKIIEAALKEIGVYMGLQAFRAEGDPNGKYVAERALDYLAQRVAEQQPRPRQLRPEEAQAVAEAERLARLNASRQARAAQVAQQLNTTQQIF